MHVQFFSHRGGEAVWLAAHTQVIVLDFMCTNWTLSRPSQLFEEGRAGRGREDVGRLHNKYLR